MVKEKKKRYGDRNRYAEREEVMREKEKEK